METTTVCGSTGTSSVCDPWFAKEKLKSSGLDNVQSEMKQCLWKMSGQQLSLHVSETSEEHMSFTFKLPFKI